VTRVPPKAPRLQLNRESYDRLRHEVLSRDGWKCQSCGSMSNLEVHHQQFRSQGGRNSEENLITLCTGCHSRLHLSTSVI
jgi:5-methylcytosine-specific restriction endonuclease McrA